MSDMTVQQAALAFDERLQKYPVEEILAVGAISKNVLNGCCWEFVRKSSEYVQTKSAFDKNPNVSMQEISYGHNVQGYLIYMNMNYLCNILDKEAKGLINAEDLEKAKKHRNEAVIALSNRMKNGYKGRIGIYCTNDSQAITVQGKTFPAYALTLREMLKVAERYGYGVIVGKFVRKPADIAAREDAVLKSLIVAPSSNAMFIDIAPMQ